jgi:phenylacetate-CoA ligase
MGAVRHDTDRAPGGTVHAWLVPRVIFPLAERLAARRMWSEVQRARDLQWRSREELDARTGTRLQALVRHAAQHVPYYRDRFREVGLAPEDVRAPSDLSRLPITSKADLRAAFPSRTTAENLPGRRRRRMMTSGSTGLPFEFYWDRASADVLFGAYLFSLEWAGVAIWDTRIAIASPPYFYQNVVPSSAWRRLARRVVLGERNETLPATEPAPGKFAELIRRVPTAGRYFIRGYPSSIGYLAARLEEDGTALARYPAAVMTFAETLTAANAAAIGRAFRSRVVNYYSSWEVPQMAQTCPDNPELLHVNSERVILRVVRPDGSPAPAGEAGRVVVTDLANHVMPFINYFTGDCAVAGPACACGRSFPALSSLEGRDLEVIRTPGGRQINGGVLGQFIAFVLGGIPYVWEFQAVQTAPDAVTLRIVPTTRFTREFARRLEHELATFLGGDVSVTIDVVDRIPSEPSGKRFIIRSEMRDGTAGAPMPAGSSDQIATVRASRA